ncbi:hypothetical protein SAMN05192533_106259 [Mesobacillus persicus]|uniref:Uncharacterized protein n=1 Tax=Mesobacillus persicus TaxID=930146 RepID=A0A1H8C255_9BACI|nr:hypothetical protein [Mesobacillus persicus]SEM89072.1 hypothetical protein SAMN05192533_106259 [Mesobacillus persicus]
MAEISIISMIFTALLALICMFLVTAPYFTWDAYFNKQVEGEASVNSKEVLLTTLNELEFEHKMNKLSDTDYFQLKKQYENQVAKIMKDEQQQTTTKLDKNLMAEVEREIEAATSKYQNRKGEN